MVITPLEIIGISVYTVNILDNVDVVNMVS